MPELTSVFGAPCPVFCINLARSAQRRRHMVQELTEVGWAAEFVEAVDGTGLDLQSLRQRGMVHPQAEGLSGELTAAEIGCALSHLEAWHRLWGSSATVGLICEDDLHFAPRFDLHRLVRRIPADADLVYLYYHLGGMAGPPYDPEEEPVVDLGTRTLRRGWSCGTTLAYLVTRKALPRLLRRATPVRYPVDGFLGRLALDGELKIYVVDPRPVSTAPFPSTIR